MDIYNCIVSNNYSVADILSELVDHFAYDDGATDSGVHDPVRRLALTSAIRKAMESDTYRRDEAKWAREYWLSDEAIKQGYGVESLRNFFRWVEEDLL